MIQNDLKLFLHNAIEDIDENNFDWLYQEWDYTLIEEESYRVHELTDVLLEAGINPLEHMTFLPSNYLRESNNKTIVVPKNVKQFYSDAISSCNDCTLFLPQINPALVRRRMIENCKRLTIYFAGTRAQWQAIEAVGAVFFCPSLVVNCKDGQYERI